MHQVLVRIPLPGTERAVSIYGYGAMLCLGFLVAIWVAAWRARREGQRPEPIYNAALAAFAGGVVGARAFHVIQRWDSFGSVWDLMAIWEGGLTFYGGVLLAAVLVVAYLVLSKRPVWYWADIIAPSVAIGLMFGRFGCTLNGCCYGDTTGVGWAFAWPAGSIPWQHYAAEAFPEAPMTELLQTASAAWAMPAIHPTQLYSALNALLLFVVLNSMFRWKRRHGQVMLSFVLLYGVSRFLLELLRADEPETFMLGLPTALRALGLEEWAEALPRLTVSQNVAIVMVAGAAVALALLMRSKAPTVQPDYAPEPDPDPRRGARSESQAKHRKGNRQ